MKLLKVCVLLVFAAAFLLPGTLMKVAESQSAAAATEAPTGFDTLTNGLVDQPTHDADRAVFEERDTLFDGLGPIYNAQSCAECHQQPVVGAISQVTELRCGHNDANGNFVNPSITLGGSGTVVPNRSLVNDRSVCPCVTSEGQNLFNHPDEDVQERVPGSENIRTFRTSLNTLGDGFVEAIDSNILFQISQQQPGQSGGRIQGLFIQVPVFEANGALRGARFGWKNQMASLLSFSSDAYLNEQGITNRFNQSDFTSICDAVPETAAHPFEDNPDKPAGQQDLDFFARFMRASKAPSRDTSLAATPDGQAGSHLFDSIGCAICHVRTFTTVAPGTVINGGQLTVDSHIGNKIIHPFSDFLLHDVGTGDGIVQNGGPASANRMRTPPLWGMRTRNRLMHDGESMTRTEAILRHAGEATFVINNFRSLGNNQKNQLITFLNSL